MSVLVMGRAALFSSPGYTPTSYRKAPVSHHAETGRKGAGHPLRPPASS